jgi:hypothetical protein
MSLEGLWEVSAATLKSNRNDLVNKMMFGHEDSEPWITQLS